MKIDLHCHTLEHSGCAQAPAVEMLLSARARGLDGVAVTDHHHHLTAKEQASLQQAVPDVRIFRGAEISVRSIRDGEMIWEDVLVISDRPSDPLFELDGGEIDALLRYAEATGALTVLAHPWRYHDGFAFDLEQFTPDAVEIASVNIDAEAHDAIACLAREWGMNVVATNDAHTPLAAGVFHIDLDEEVVNERQLARAVRAGDYALGLNAQAVAEWRLRFADDEGIAQAVLATGGDLQDFLGRGGREQWVFESMVNGRTRRLNDRIAGLRNPA
jgi:hypothetical protein